MGHLSRENEVTQNASRRSGDSLNAVNKDSSVLALDFFEESDNFVKDGLNVLPNMIL